MNAGYVGYNYSENSDSDQELTMTVFRIQGNEVQIERYDKKGLHLLKTRGVWSSYANETREWYGAEDTYLEKEYASPQYID